MTSWVKKIFSPEGHGFALLVITAVVLLLTGRYLLYGVPHEFITGEYKGTFEGDYDFTLELVRSFARWGKVPAWSETYSGPIAVFASNFHVFLQALLYPLTHNLAVSIKILQALQILTAGLAMYLLSSHLYRDRVSAAFSATLYMFTPFYIGHLLSYLHYTGVYMLGPLAYLLILKTVREASLRSAALLPVVVAYSLLSHPQNVFIGGIFYALFYAAVFSHEAVVRYREGGLGAYAAKAAALTILVVSLTGLLSSFIMLPTLSDGYPYMRTSWVKGAGELVKIDAGHIGSHSQTFLSSITLQHWPWFQTPLKGGAYPPWPYMAVYLTPFVFAIFSLLIRFDWITALFVAISALSVEMSLGVNGEPDLFTLASRHIPFFGMSRTPYAYINAAILSFCLLSSITFSWLSRKLSSLSPTGSRGSAREINAPTTGMAGARWLVFALIAAPYLAGARYYGNDYNWTFISAKEPAYLSQVWSWMGEHNRTRGRVIETCGIPTAMILGERMLPNQVDILERHSRKEYLSDYLSLLGFKYVITPSSHSRRSLTFDRTGYMIPSVFDGADSLEEFYSALTTEYYHIYERLKEDPDFRLHTASTRDVAIFENRKAVPDYEVYPGRAVMVLGGTDSYDLLALKGFRHGDGKRPVPVFMAQKENLARADEIKGASSSLVLHNTDALDLGALISGDHIRIVRPAPKDPGPWELAINSFGIQQPFPQQDHSIGNSVNGEMSFAPNAITSRAEGASVRAEFRAEEGGVLMLRYMAGPVGPALSYSIDGTKRGTLSGPSNRSFNWVRLGTEGISPGVHKVEVTLEENKPVYIDSFAVVSEKDALDKAFSAAVEFSGDMPVTYVLNHRKFSFSDGVLSSNVKVISGGQYSASVRLAWAGGDGGGGGRGGVEEAVQAKAQATGQEAAGREGEIRVFIDDNQIGIVPLSELKEWPEEFSFAPFDLPGKDHTITLKGVKKGVYFSLASLSTVQKNPEETAGGGGDKGFSFERTGPSSYSIRSASRKDRFIVFNETNYHGWTMVSGNESLKPVITNMFMNGFIIPDHMRGTDGSFRAEITYSNRAQNSGLKLSLAAVAVSAVIVIAPSLSRKRKKNGSGRGVRGVRGGRGGRRERGEADNG